jgi:uncharacterized membrane-anchored protein
MLRDVTATVLGLAVAIAVIMGIQMVGHAIWPPPESLDWKDTEVVRTYVSQLPFLALLFPILSYFLGALAGPVVASKIGTARPVVFAGIIGLVLLAFTIANLIQIPHPHWFSALAVAAVPVGAWLAMNIVSHGKD